MHIRSPKLAVRMVGRTPSVWRHMDQELRVIPEGERVIAGGY